MGWGGEGGDAHEGHRAQIGRHGEPRNSPGHPLRASPAGRQSRPRHLLPRWEWTRGGEGERWCHVRRREKHKCLATLARAKHEDQCPDPRCTCPCALNRSPNHGKEAAISLLHLPHQATNSRTTFREEEEKKMNIVPSRLCVPDSPGRTLAAGTAAASPMPSRTTALSIPKAPKAQEPARWRVHGSTVLTALCR